MDAITPNHEPCHTPAQAVFARLHAQKEASLVSHVAGCGVSVTAICINDKQNCIIDLLGPHSMVIGFVS
jgi:hypothetical protein